MASITSIADLDKQKAALISQRTATILAFGGKSNSKLAKGKINVFDVQIASIDSKLAKMMSSDDVLDVDLKDTNTQESVKKSVNKSKAAAAACDDSKAAEAVVEADKRKAADAEVANADTVEPDFTAEDVDGYLKSPPDEQAVYKQIYPVAARFFDDIAKPVDQTDFKSVKQLLDMFKNLTDAQKDIAVKYWASVSSLHINTLYKYKSLKRDDTSSQHLKPTPAGINKPLSGGAAEEPSRKSANALDWVQTAKTTPRNGVSIISGPLGPVINCTPWADDSSDGSSDGGKSWLAELKWNPRNSKIGDGTLYLKVPDDAPFISPDKFSSTVEGTLLILNEFKNQTIWVYVDKKTKERFLCAKINPSDKNMKVLFDNMMMFVDKYDL